MAEQPKVDGAECDADEESVHVDIHLITVVQSRQPLECAAPRSDCIGAQAQIIMSIPVPTQHPLTSLPLPDPEAYPGEPREYARALMQRKDEIEQAIVSYHFWAVRKLTTGYIE